MITTPRRLLVSRTDAIGDVVLTLPLATLLRQRFPEAKIGFMGKQYTRAVIECCSAVDEFVDVDDFLKAKRLASSWDAIIHVFPRQAIALHAWRAGIRLRIGTSSRPYHWMTCNKLVTLSRRHSPLHEAQLNAELLAPLGIEPPASQAAFGSLYAFDRLPPLPASFAALLQPGKRHIILHPKSQGSAREWGLAHFEELIRLLPATRYQFFISGTPADAVSLQPLLRTVGDRVTDITGKMDLRTFIAFIAACDALVAASTGPLHIAAALGKQTIGLYPSIRPMHAGRWGPLGPEAQALYYKADCQDCREEPEACYCIKRIEAAQVAELLAAR